MTNRDILKEQAWIGDAVLALYVRLRILRDGGRVDGPKAVRMSSNHFLSAWGEPTAVEAEIGRAYSAEGLEAAFRLIETKFMPLFERREAASSPASGPPRRSQRKNHVP